MGSPSYRIESDCSQVIAVRLRPLEFAGRLSPSLRRSEAMLEAAFCTSAKRSYTARRQHGSSDLQPVDCGLPRARCEHTATRGDCCLRFCQSNQTFVAALSRFVPTFVAFNLAANSCTPADLHSQSVIGEINLLTAVIPGSIMVTEGGATGSRLKPTRPKKPRRFAT